MGGSRHRKGGLSIVRSPARTRHFNKREGRLETGIFPSSARSCQSISAHGSALLRLCNKTLRPRGGFCAGARTARAGNGPEEGSRRTCARAATSLRVFHRPSDFSCCPLTAKVSRSRDHAAGKPRLYAATAEASRSSAFSALFPGSVRGGTGRHSRHGDRREH